jgi:hypothetical protein
MEKCSPGVTNSFRKTSQKMEAEALCPLLAPSPFLAVSALVADGDQNITRVLRQNSLSQMRWLSDTNYPAKSFIRTFHSFSQSSETKLGLAAESFLCFFRWLIASSLSYPYKKPSSAQWEVIELIIVIRWWVNTVFENA